ncbi:MAG: ABC transporter substrate-binding protein, partial [Anaerolineales bacterium]
MKAKLLTLLMVTVMLLTACGGGAATEAPAAPAQPATEEPAQPAPAETEAPMEGGGGTVTLIIPEEPTTLNYFQADAAIVRQVAEATSMTGLVTIDQNGDFVPMLAEELPTLDNGGLSEDYSTVTWKLKPDLKWSDGEPVTSDDIKFTWEVLSSPDAGALTGTGGFDQIASVETPDD